MQKKNNPQTKLLLNFCIEKIVSKKKPFSIERQFQVGL